MIRTLLLALALAAGASSAAQAQTAAATADPTKVGPYQEGQKGVPLSAGLNGALYVAQTPTGAFSVAKTAGIGTAGVLVSAADATNRRTVRNTGPVACEIMPSAAAYGAGHPLPVAESFTFDASGRTTAALYVACASAGGSVSVISY